MCVVIQFDSIYAIRNLLLSTNRLKGCPLAVRDKSKPQLNKGNNKITEFRTILQRESQNS